MNRIKKNFICFRCHYNNHVSVPIYFNGLKCRRCHKFNYFNYINNRNRNNRRNNQNNTDNNIQRLNNELSSLQRDIININNYLQREIERNNNNNTINIERYPNNRNIPLHSSIQNNNNSSIIHDIIDYLSDNDFNNILLNNFIPNMQQPQINNLYNQNINNDRIILWLKKEKFTENISIKYGKDIICTICLEDITNKEEDIHITKCGHIFHYKCITEYINKDKNKCPNCRSIIGTG